MVAEIRNCVTRPAIARLAFIGTLLRDYQPFTANTIARKFECSRRTVIRDLEFMRDRLDWPIQWDAESNAYKLDGTPPAASI